MREKLIDSIVEYSSDELDINDIIEIAKESDEQLVDRLICILEWYKDLAAE